MGGAGRPPAWRVVAAAAVALWLVPVAVTTVVLWLPLLCCAVAAVRFRRARRMGMPRGCRDGAGGGGRCAEKDGAGGDRLRLLQQYLEDQMELVGGDGAGEMSPSIQGNRSD